MQHVIIKPSVDDVERLRIKPLHIRMVEETGEVPSEPECHCQSNMNARGILQAERKLIVGTGSSSCSPGQLWWQREQERGQPPRSATPSKHSDTTLGIFYKMSLRPHSGAL